MLRKPLPFALAALAAVAGASQFGTTLVLAQSAGVEGGGPPPQAAPEPAANAPAPAAPLTPPPLPSPAVRTAAPAASPLLRPGSEQYQPRPVARSEDPVDQSIDALQRDGVVTKAERDRIRVRGGFTLPRLDQATRDQMCDSGALSQKECRTGVVFRGRGRGEEPGGSGPGAVGVAMGSYGGERGGIDAAPLPPISVPVTALLSGSGGSFRLTDVFRVTPRPSPLGGNGNARMLYPLIGSSVTTSAFGWRLHPVVGTWLMHSGRDLAAPEGTPVVAALSGRVVMSGTAGGYGLAVELEHDRPRRRTLYGHLSELYVREGDNVRQGEVIGRVGSTGLSTGPHLHFELRLPQDGGWVATDPGDLDPGGAAMAASPLQPGMPARRDVDAVALLMGQLIQTLERPISPLPTTAAPNAAKNAAPNTAMKPAPRG
jgi:murein DD-endopeptidase MepM/ murein hydrolase activator NlpD